MAANPQLLKVISLTIDGEDFSMDVIDCMVKPTPGAVQTVKTLDGHKHQDTEAEVWALEGNAVVDWDNARPGLAWYANAHKGELVPFVFHDVDAAVSAGSPSIAGNLILVPLQYGGPGNAYASAAFSFPIDGDPVLDHTP